MIELSILILSGLLVALTAQTDLPWAAIITWAGLSFVTWRLLQNKNEVGERIKLLAARARGGGEILGASDKRVSQRQLHSDLDLLSYRVQILEDLASRPQDRTGIEQELVEIVNSELSSMDRTGDSGPIFQSVLHLCRRQFACNAAFLAVEGADQLSLSTLYLNGSIDRGIRTAVERLARRWWSSAATGSDGLILPDELGVPGEVLMEHGYRALIRCRFTHTQSGGNRKAVLILAYRETGAPRNEEIFRAREFVRLLSEQLTSRSRLLELSGRTTEMELRVRQKDDLIAHMSHDIRSPLNNIKSILSLVRADSADPETQNLVDVAIANCSSVAEIVEDLLDYSRHRAGTLTARREALDLSILVREVALIFSTAAMLKGLTLDVAVPPEGVVADVDRRHLRRVLSNLVGNAIKYTQLGSVQVRLFAEGADWRIEIVDTGVGLSPEQQSQLFTPFTRFHGSEIEGVGLGLALSKILAELNGVKIEVDSKPGRGSTFSLRGQCSESTHCPIPIQKPLDCCATESPLRILVVDDDPVCAEGLARNLALLGHRTAATSSVREAIAMLNFGDQDLMLTDAEMPDGGGAALLDHVREKGLQTACFVITGNVHSAVSRSFTGRGSVVVLEKPVELDRLQRAIFELPRRSLGIAACG